MAVPAFPKPARALHASWKCQRNLSREYGPLGIPACIIESYAKATLSYDASSPGAREKHPASVFVWWSSGLLGSKCHAHPNTRSNASGGSNYAHPKTRSIQWCRLALTYSLSSGPLLATKSVASLAQGAASHPLRTTVYSASKCIGDAQRQHPHCISGAPHSVGGPHVGHPVIRKGCPSVQ